MPKTVSIYTSTGKKSGSMKLPAAVFDAKVNQSLLAQAVRVYLSNQRRGLAKAKGRGELTSISTAKIWRQKGTGRARHSSRRAPIFVGGGKAHGPDGTQNYRSNFPKKMRQAALKSALAAQKEQVVVVKDLDKLTGKTKAAAKLLAALGKANQPVAKALVVLGKRDAKVERSWRNLPQVRIRLVSELTTFDVLSAQQIIFTQESITELKKRMAGPVKTRIKKKEE